jgi:hypothetical protein
LTIEERQRIVVLTRLIIRKFKFFGEVDIHLGDRVGQDGPE